MHRILQLFAVTGLLLSMQSNAADMTVQPLRSIETSQTTGYSMLVRKEQSLLIRLETAMPAETREVWWLVFNNPGECAARPCGFSDIFRQETAADLILASDAVVGSDGHTNICLRAAHPGRSLMPEFGLSAAGLRNIEGAEVQVIVAGAVPGLESLITRRNVGFTGNCAGGECSPLMVAVHQPRAPRLAAAGLGR